MRRTNPIVIALAAATAFAMFVVSYRVKALEDEIGAVTQARVASERSAHVLRAEWTFLTDPERLADLARRNLALGPAAPQQLVAYDAVPALDTLVTADADAQAQTVQP